jgi:hypothetical protein
MFQGERVPNEKFRFLYQMVIDNLPLTRQNLLRVNITPEEIEIFLRINILRKTTDDTYEFIDLNRLYSYGKYLLIVKDFNRAFGCFCACTRINPKMSSARFMSLFMRVKRQEFDIMRDELILLMNDPNKEFERDTNVYLILLADIISLPSDVAERIRSLQLSEVALPESDCRYNDTDREIINNVRFAIWKRKFSHAFKQLNDYASTKHNLNSPDTLIKFLLYHAMENQSSRRNKIDELMNKNDYLATYELLSEERKWRKLPKSESFLHSLLSSYFYIKEKNRIPESTGIGNSLFQNIVNNNYKIALKECLPIDSYIKKMLGEICKLIDENCKKTKIDEIINYIKNNDLESAVLCLRTYLGDNQARELEYLTIGLIKASVIEGDEELVDIREILTNLNDKDKYLDFDLYEEKYYSALQSGNNKLANAYLDIMQYINESKNLEKELPEPTNDDETKKQMGFIRRLFKKM